jgi:hypothetical protein
MRWHSFIIPPGPHEKMRAGKVLSSVLGCGITCWMLSFWPYDLAYIVVLSLGS